MPLPLTVTEQLCHQLDEPGEPWDVHVEAAVEGRLDPGRLRAAVAAALVAHPMAGARLAGAGRARGWELPAVPDPDCVLVEAAGDERAVRRARDRFLSEPVSVVGPPTLRVLLLSAPAGDIVVLHLAHAVADGVAALTLLASIATAYAGRALPPDPDRRPVPARLTLRAGTARDLLVRAAHAARGPVHLAGEGGAPGPGWATASRRLDLAALRAAARTSRGATVNDVLVAALHLAVDGWQHEHGRPAGLVSVMVPVDLRTASEAGMGCWALPVSVPTTAAERRTPAGCLAAVHLATTTAKRRDAARSLLAAGLLPGRLRARLPHRLPLLGDRTLDTVVLSNLGVVTPPDFGLPLRRLAFSPPARMPIGYGVGVVTVGGAVWLTARWRPALLDRPAGERLTDALVAAVRPPGCPVPPPP